MNEQTQSQSLTILLVEDHEDSRKAMQGWFEMQGYTILGARDMKSALKVGQKSPFDVLLCDVQLPDGDGRKLLAKLSAGRKIVGLAMSGHCAPSDLARTKAAGFLAHLIKPFTIDEVGAMLISAQRELKRRSAGTLAKARNASKNKRHARRPPRR